MTDKEKKFSHMEKIRSILARSTYVQCPIIDAYGEPTGQLRRVLYVPFDSHEVREKASQEVKLLNMLGTAHGYIQGVSGLWPTFDLDDSHIKPRLADLRASHPDFLLQDDVQLAETLDQRRSFDAINPPYRGMYEITKDIEHFEDKWLPYVGHQIIPSLQQIQAEWDMLTDMHRDIVDHFRGRMWGDSKGKHIIAYDSALSALETHPEWERLLVDAVFVQDNRKFKVCIVDDPLPTVNRLALSSRMDESVGQLEMGEDCPFQHTNTMSR